MKILFIHGDKREPGQAGGAESLLRDQAEGLKLFGHECSWWYGEGSLVDALREFKPDICHLMTIHCYPMGLEPARHLQRNRIPHVWHIQDYWPFCASRMMVIGDQSCSGVSGVCQHECGHHAPKEYLEVCNQSPIVAGNANTAQIYQRNGLRCDYVVELGVDVDKFCPSRKDNPPTIYASASILAGEWKGMHILRQALDGTPYAARMISGAPRSVVAAELRHASIFVFPSCYEETFGLSLCEAMSAGCACITTDNAGGKAQIVNGLTGLIVPKRNPDALREAILMLIEDPELRKELGQAARMHAVKSHSLEAMAQRWENVYREALEESMV